MTEVNVPTMRELAYARDHGKLIRFLEPEARK